LIGQVARCIETNSAASARGNDSLAHRPAISVPDGNGELSLLLRSRISAEHVATVVHAVLESLTREAASPDVDFVPAVSAGVALVEAIPSPPKQLLGNAHMRPTSPVIRVRAPSSSPLPQAHARRRLLMESALHGALERRELHLVFQPRMTIEDVRPDRGRVPKCAGTARSSAP
jgi:hypothetical protein